MLHAFQVVIPATIPTWLVILGALVPIVAGWLANLAMDGVKQLIPKLDAAPTIVKQVLAVVIAALIGWLNAKLGTSLADDPHTWTAAAFSVVFTVLAQQGIYRWKANNQAAAQGNATKEQQATGAAAPVAFTPQPVPTSER